MNRRTLEVHCDGTDDIAALGPWFHNLHLPDGRHTAPNHPLGDFPENKWQLIEAYVPADLTGWRVLDVGCNAGYYSFQLASRGAHVTGIDADARYLQQAAWAAKQFGLDDRVQFLQKQVYEVANEDEPYDLIWFMGVLYHLRYPMLALDILAKKVRKLMMFQTLTMPGDQLLDVPDDLDLDERKWFCDAGWPKMAFIPKRFAGDPTNWWSPNHACIHALFQSIGLEVIAQPGHELYLCQVQARDPQTLEPMRQAEYECATTLGATRIDRRER
jgi:tRNA (mo5U34)-methyltransferase